MRIREIGPILKRRHGGPVRKLGIRLGTSCPHRSAHTGGCAFCADGPAREPPSLVDQLERGIARLGSEVAIVAYLQDHSATLLSPRRLDRVLAEIGSHREVVAITVGTRPDCLPPGIIDVLADHATRFDLLVELGLQTVSDRTLRFIHRRHDTWSFQTATRRLHQRGLRVCAHVILGLPSPAVGGIRPEGIEQAIATARQLAALEVEAVKVHNCHVLNNTPLADLLRCGLFYPPGAQGYVDRLIAFLEHLPRAVEVHRLVGEARRPALLAPAFTANKSRMLQHIRTEMERRDTCQGRCSGGRAGALDSN